MDEVIQALTDFARVELLPLLLAIAILVVGWIAADIVARALRALLLRTPLDAKLGGALAGDQQPPLSLSSGIAEVTRWLIVLFAALLFADTLGLDTTGGPVASLLSGALAALPRVAVALVIIALGFGVATVLRRAVVHVFGTSKVAQRIDAAGDDDPTLAESLGAAVHGLTVLFALLLALDVLRMDSMVEPLGGPAQAILVFLPRLFACVAILGAGWLLAVIVRRGVTLLLEATGLDDVARRAGSDRAGVGRLSHLIGTIAFALVLLPVLTAALDALGLSSTAASARELLAELLAAVPRFVHAAVVLLVGLLVGSLLGGFAGDLLARLGLDRLLERIGLERPDASRGPSRRPSAMAGGLVRIAVVVVAAAEALRLIGLGRAGELVIATCLRSGDWALGLIVIGLGLWLARAVDLAVSAQGRPTSRLLGFTARVAIAVLALVAGLEQMGLATWAVRNGFLAALAGLALGAGLAFGVGGRRHAADLLRSWRGRWDRRD